MLYPWLTNLEALRTVCAIVGLVGSTDTLQELYSNSFREIINKPVLHVPSLNLAIARFERSEL